MCYTQSNTADLAMDYLSSIPISFLWVYSSDPALVTNGNTHVCQYIHVYQLGSALCNYMYVS